MQSKNGLDHQLSPPRSTYLPDIDFDKWMEHVLQFEAYLFSERVKELHYISSTVSTLVRVEIFQTKL